MSALTGMLLENRNKEQREELLKQLEGGSATGVSPAMDTKLRETYAEEGYSDLRILMLEEIRHANGNSQRIAEIKSRYSKMAAEQRRRASESSQEA